MKLTTRALAVLLLCPVLALSQSALTPDDISRRISETGARSTLNKMYDEGRPWREVLTSIGMGDAAWLKVAVLLYPGSDAGATRQLILATGEALEHQPRVVLEIAVPAFGIEDVCGGPDVDDSRYDSYALSIKAIEARIKMLRAVSDLQLSNIRERCIMNLENSKVGIANFYGIRK